MTETWRGKLFGANGFERLVAIKRILPHIADDDECIQMFINEARIGVQLAHDNLAFIFELGQVSNSYFIAKQYVAGKDMRALFDECRKKGEPAPIPLVAFVVSRMCEGLDYAHRTKDNRGQDINLVHCNVSPENILISFEGEVKVIDFGRARPGGKVERPRVLPGPLQDNLGYMSPERIAGLPLDKRSDIFAIGVCLYELLTGERLFEDDSGFSVLDKVRKAEVAPPSTYNRLIPEALDKIVLKALARNVDERYQHANELGRELQPFLSTPDTGVERKGVLQSMKSALGLRLFLSTRDAGFRREDLMRYMKSAFAEDVEREERRLQDYAAIKRP